MALPMTSAGPVGIGVLCLGADDQAEAVDVVGLAFRIDDSDAGDALPGPLAGEAKRIGRSVCLSANERTL